MSAALLTPDELTLLVDVAERSVHLAVLEHVRWQPEPTAYPEALRRPAAVFVTLERQGRLMGCIGTLTPGEPMVVAVADRARAAALADPRFRAIGPDDLPELDVSVSVLSPPAPIAAESYDELVAALRAGIDGVIIEAGRHRATFLPAVWDDLPEPEGFVAALWRKAGLAPRSWPREAQASRYTAQHAPRH
ncbi:MAG: AmmeMemoRadiSam system protein A [Ilumatobacteraceae bacterium]